MAENTPAHEALSAELFDSSGGETPDFSEAIVRRRVMKCIDYHSDILIGFERLLGELGSLEPPPDPWCVVDIERLPFQDNVFVNFAQFVEKTCDGCGSYRIAFGVAPVNTTNVSLDPITGASADDTSKEIILKTCPTFRDLEPHPSIMSLFQLNSQFARLLPGREDFRVECSEGDHEGSLERDEDHSVEDEVTQLHIDYPVHGMGVNKANQILAFIHEFPAT